MTGFQREHGWGSMSGYRNDSPGSQVNLHVRAATARRATFALVLLVAGAAAAQDSEPPPSAAPPPAGLFDALGRWLGDSKSRIDNHIKNTTDAAKDAAEKAGQATTGIVLWPGSKVAHGRVRCTVAPNGAPDCTEAANALCRSKGYGPGQSLEINTAEKCPTWVWLSGRPAPEGTCKIENFVLQAACQ
jgi:hypothetical protein